MGWVLTFLLGIATGVVAMFFGFVWLLSTWRTEWQRRVNSLTRYVANYDDDIEEPCENGDYLKYTDVLRLTE